MSAAERMDNIPDDPPALATALRLLDSGLWPIPISHPDDERPWIGTPGKQPAAGKNWGKVRPTADWLRAFWAGYPLAGVGIKLGKAAGVVDVEIDDMRTGPSTVAILMGGEVVETMGWTAAKGGHSLFRWDDRLAAYEAVYEHDPRLPGLGLRFGSADDEGKQVQSVCPPSPTTYKVGDATFVGKPRAWNGVEEIAGLPAVFFENLGRILAAPKPTPSDRKSSTVPPDAGTSSGTSGRWTAVDRARAYLANVPPAVSGEAGHNRTFRTACNVGCGFDLTAEQFLPIFSEWNARCVPPWSEREIYHKVNDAYTKEQRRGWLLAENGNSESHSNGSFEGSEASEGGFPGNKVQEKPWKVPRLFEPLPPVPFPLDVLPVSLQELCRDGARALQCPADYWASYALALAGAVIGLSVNLVVKPHYHESSLLYVAVVGPPGTKKSPPLKILSRSLWDIDTDLRGKYDREKREYEAACKRSDADPSIPPPTRLQLTMDNTTTEAIGPTHAENPRGLALIKDELTAWVKSLDAYRNGKGDDLQFWLKNYSGSLVKVDRKGNREQIIIPQPNITVVGGLTPASIPTLCGGSDNGWIDRLVFSYPAPMEAEDWSEFAIADDLLDDWSRAVKRLWGREMPPNERGRPRPTLISMTEPARNLWREWVNRHRAESRHADFARSLRGPWAKMEGAAARLALILSQLHQAYDDEQWTYLPGDDDDSPPSWSAKHPPRNVDPQDIWGATQLADYFKAHFKRAINELLSRPELVPDDVEAIIKWLRKARSEPMTSFSERDLKLNFQGRFRDKPLALADSLAWLVARDCIRPGAVEPKAVGRPHSPIYLVNPHLSGEPSENPDFQENHAQNLQNYQNDDEA